MKRAIFFHSLAIIMLIGVFNIFISHEQPATTKENFYPKSLYYTNKGIEYLYAKEQGGIERILA